MKEKKNVQTDKAPGAVGPYSQAIRSGNLVFVSGQLPINPEIGKMPEGPITDRAHQSLKNMTDILEAVGAGLNDIVKTTVFLADIKDFAEVNEVYSQYFDSPFPARSAVEVANLPLGADIEIEAIATID